MYTSSFEQCLDLGESVSTPKTFHKELIRTDIQSEEQFNKCKWFLSQCGINVDESYTYYDYKKEHPLEEYEFVDIEG